MIILSLFVLEIIILDPGNCFCNNNNKQSNDNRP